MTFLKFAADAETMENKNGNNMKQFLINNQLINELMLINVNNELINELIGLFWSWQFGASQGFAHHCHTVVAGLACVVCRGRFSPGSSCNTSGTLRSSSGECPIS